MEDKDKRNSSEPSASSVSSGDGSSQPPGARRGSEPEMFDAHEQTLPRFTIDPGEAAPRQRTRTLLGVPSLVNESDEVPLRPPTPPAMQTAEDAADVAPTTKLSSAILGSQQVPETVLEGMSEGIIDITVEVDEDLHDLHDLNEVTMVSDADVLALPDNTGQLQPVRLDELAAAGAGADEPKTSAEPAYAATAPHPNSLSPREVSRPAAPQQPRDRTGRSGALLVAAVMLVATGAWFMTAGTFRRATLSTPAESTTAAATQPTTATEKKVEQPAVPAAPAETPAPTSAETVSAAPSTVAPPTTTGKSEDVAAPALKQKPALTASARGERVRRSGRASKANATPAPTGEVPTGPTRSEVVARLESVRSSVQTCAAGRSGVADLDITIAHTGVVMHVLVGGDFAGTTEGSCIARAVRQARFPQFKQERFRLLYPYAI